MYNYYTRTHAVFGERISCEADVTLTEKYFRLQRKLHCGNCFMNVRVCEYLLMKHCYLHIYGRRIMFVLLDTNNEMFSDATLCTQLP